MGVDVNLYAKGVVTDNELMRANDYITERLGVCDLFYSDWLTRSDYDRVAFSTMQRYYGPHYERGDWPTIYSDIRVLKGALPECTVHYGGDYDNECPEVDDNYLDDIWNHWLGPHGQDYRKDI